ncbi:MAG: hypothetical protein J6S95_05790 [Lachnospiraceae bacterium]|nr:hypothetical protein [Lachnospiraceae bacterium]
MDGNNFNNDFNNQNQQAQSQYSTQPIPPVYNQQTYNSGINYGMPPQPYQDPKNLEPVPIGTWLGIMFLSLIPCVNIIMLFVWAFSEGRESRKNWAKAQLIFIAIMIVLEIVLMVLFGAAIFAFYQEFFNMYM